jgi:hypothetical protein
MAARSAGRWAKRNVALLSAFQDRCKKNLRSSSGGNSSYFQAGFLVRSLQIPRGPEPGIDTRGLHDLPVVERASLTRLW